MRLGALLGSQPAGAGARGAADTGRWSLASGRHQPDPWVKPFVRRNKTGARSACPRAAPSADPGAAAICAALGRPDMRCVAIKSVDRQAARGLQRGRELLVKQRTQLMNCVRSQLAEFGVIATAGGRGFAELSARAIGEDPAIPPLLRLALRARLSHIEALHGSIAPLEAQIMAAAKADPVMRRLTTIPGVGGLTAHAIVTAVGDGRQFRSARDFAAWCGLTPREHASAGKRRKTGISREGELRLPKLLALGASTIIRSARRHRDRATQWQRGILARRPVKSRLRTRSGVAVLAQAAKTARIAWAMLISGEPYRNPSRAAAAGRAV